ncbi:MAG: bifunctional 4-hydroxy-2-oxoglutarate aldolase/2-dehydro-3-deoxy-phosphogluconate aldolase [Clostridiales bacterium]|jgi:2-dehydro-3-deoxyphosphogluconate aldolase/(4S)-4-hydroxy-2-oxoglutarate aldolase|nr:bifunctional 4-hydroxy-2-oxoglutarate aldolase/2-dehydro-3-deoxy-phosphogluconate aldolase [Clostridiales bacterium]
MTETERRIFECGLIPVIKLEEAETADKLGAAFLEGGLDVMEVTFRTAAAAEAIRILTEKQPDVFVGAGTVLSADIAKKAAAAGAKFIVTPGFNAKVVEYCLEQGLPVFPGISTPSEIEAALNYGLSTLKFFPAEQSGGVKMLKAMSAPYGMVKFIPTGGITAANLGDYARFGKVLAIGGSWMVREDDLRAKSFKNTIQVTREAVLALHGFQFANIAIHAGPEAALHAHHLNRLFGPGLDCAGNQLKFLTDTAEETLGYIEIKTNNVQRAAAYVKKLGCQLDDAAKGSQGLTDSIGLKDQYAGFRIKLIPY